MLPCPQCHATSAYKQSIDARQWLLCPVCQCKMLMAHYYHEIKRLTEQLAMINATPAFKDNPNAQARKDYLMVQLSADKQ